MNYLMIVGVKLELQLQAAEDTASAKTQGVTDPSIVRDILFNKMVLEKEAATAMSHGTTCIAQAVRHIVQNITDVNTVSTRLSVHNGISVIKRLVLD